MTPKSVDSSLISSVTVASRAARLHPLLPPPPTAPQRRIHGHSFTNNDFLLHHEKSDSGLNDHNGVELSQRSPPPGSTEFDVTAENTLDGATTDAKRLRCDAIRQNEDTAGVDKERSGVTEVDLGANGGVDISFSPVQTMLLVVTADMVAAAVQSGESDGSDTVTSTATPPPQGTTPSSCVAAFGVPALVGNSAAESVGDIMHSTSSTFC